MPHAEILNFVKDNLAEKAGLDLEVKEVTDYVTPNTSTEDGSVDANYFQTQAYLDDFNKKNGTHIVPAGDVHLEPLGLYSEKVKEADELKSGATIAIPNDTINEGRALQLLAANKIITIKEGVGFEATPSDITGNPKKLKFKELEAAQTPAPGRRRRRGRQRQLRHRGRPQAGRGRPRPRGRRGQPARQLPRRQGGQRGRPAREEARRAAHLRRGQEVHRRQVRRLGRRRLLIRRPVRATRTTGTGHTAGRTRGRTAARTAPGTRPALSGSTPVHGVDPVVRSGAFMLHAGQFSGIRRSRRLRSGA
ncbi:hypothetical protein SHIRM173S_06726 [Streptomyces hirsutus]